MAGIRRRSELRNYFVRDVWILLKRLGAQNVTTVELQEVGSLADAIVETYIDDRHRTVLGALCKDLGAETFFEIGTNRGRTTWTVTHNNPAVRAFTLDLPSRQAAESLALDVTPQDQRLFERWDRGSAFDGTDEAGRIKRLYGDSATFDFSPWFGAVDLVYVDGAHSYSYVKSDTENALQMLSPHGTLVWDDYLNIPGIYAYLNELGGMLDRPIYHLKDTYLAFYSRRDIVHQLPKRQRDLQWAA